MLFLRVVCLVFGPYGSDFCGSVRSNSQCFYDFRHIGRDFKRCFITTYLRFSISIIRSTTPIDLLMSAGAKKSLMLFDFQKKDAMWWK